MPGGYFSVSRYPSAWELSLVTKNLPERTAIDRRRFYVTESSPKERRKKKEKRNDDGSTVDDECSGVTREMSSCNVETLTMERSFLFLRL